MCLPGRFNVLHPPRRQTLTCHVRLLIWQEMLFNALCNHTKRAAGQGANYINFERVSACVCVGGGCMFESVEVCRGYVSAAKCNHWLIKFAIFNF